MPAQCVPLIGDSSLSVHTNVQNTMMRCMKEAHSRDPAEPPGTVSIVVLGSIWALPQIRWAKWSASFQGSPRAGEPAVLRVTFCWFAMLTADRSCGLPREACKHIHFRDGKPRGFVRIAPVCVHMCVCYTRVAVVLLRRWGRE